MMTVVTIHTFRLFFTLLILLLNVKVSEMSDCNYNKQSDNMPDTEDKSERILISNNRLGFIGRLFGFF